MVKLVETNDMGYPEVRNFASLPHGFKVVKRADLFSILLNTYYRFSRKVHPVLQFLHYNPLRSGSLYHFFNGISFSSRFIVTFETVLPRLGNSPKWLIDLCVKKLASPQCLKIIAISECTKKLQVEYIQANYPEHLLAIVNKMVVIQPPQNLLIGTFAEKRSKPGKIFFSIIGKDFFRKGGFEVLKVFNELIGQYPVLHLNIVSDLSYADYATRSGYEDYRAAVEIIARYPSNIHHYKSLPNKEVLELLRSTDVGLLPTWADTYGYSVLEAQAAGCPVITTNIRALTEINNNEIGWIIEVPKHANGNAKIETAEERANISMLIADGLKGIILSILRNPSIVGEKGLKAFERINTCHSPLVVAEELKSLYCQSRR